MELDKTEAPIMCHNHSKLQQSEPRGNRGLGDQCLREADAPGPWSTLGKVRVWVTSKDLSRILKQGSKKESNLCTLLGTLGLAPEGRSGGITLPNEGGW